MTMKTRCLLLIGLAALSLGLLGCLDQNSGNTSTAQNMGVSPVLINLTPAVTITHMTNGNAAISMASSTSEQVVRKVQPPVFDPDFNANCGALNKSNGITLIDESYCIGMFSTDSAQAGISSFTLGWGDSIDWTFNWPAYHELIDSLDVGSGTYPGDTVLVVISKRAPSSGIDTQIVCKTNDKGYEYTTSMPFISGFNEFGSAGLGVSLDNYTTAYSVQDALLNNGNSGINQTCQVEITQGNSAVTQSFNYIPIV